MSEQSLAQLLTLPPAEQLAAWEALACAWGFADARKSAINLADLAEKLPDPVLLAAVARQALGSADPDMALNHLERCSQQQNAALLRQCLQQEHPRAVLLTLLGASSFLTGTLCRFPALFGELFVEGEIDQAKDSTLMRTQIEQRLDSACDLAGLQRVLRQYKQREILRIAARDLSGLASLQEVTAELSNLAAASLQVACSQCERLLQLEYGVPQAAAGELLEPAFTVLAMGKFGGWELNFSSDIDLIYFYATAQGRTSGIDSRGDSRIELHSYYVKLAERVTHALAQVTEDGFVFRVDLNLRPEGRSGELACSLAAAESYYESWGQNWERCALMKARPVAGDIALGQRLLKSLEPFIYRRYLDYGMVEDLRQMKLKIDNSLTREKESENNLKLGRGGIREIEFFVQALQLIYAGKNPHVRERSSLKALECLLQEGLLSPADAATLHDAYVFLRTVEHRIQVLQQQQTHNLPNRPQERAHLARRCGFDSCTDFEQRLEHHRQAVMQLYRGLFFAGEEQPEQEFSPEVRLLLDPEADADLLKDVLEANGFRQVDAAWETLARLRDGKMGPPMTRRARRAYEQILPLLVQELLASPQPDLALRHLENFLLGLRAPATFYGLLAEHPKTVALLISLFATSTFLSRFFTLHPDLIDCLVSSSHAQTCKSIEEQRAELSQRLAAYEDNYEMQLDVLRRFRNEEFLRIAFNDLQDSAALASSTQQLSTLAQVCLEQAVRLAQDEMLSRFGLPGSLTTEGVWQQAEFAVLGLGKLGGMELNYHSDLDIIFIYDGPGQTRPAPQTDPARFRALSNQEYFSRLGQRIISVLTLVTREGRVYEIDTRLRPSGNQGPLVTSLPAYEDYHQHQAQLWERQALTKARVVVASAAMRRRIDAVNARMTWEKPLPVRLAQEICRLRDRMEKEIAREDSGRFNIKTGRGGLVDVEFITQYLQLLHGQAHPSVRSPNTLEALEALRQVGVLEGCAADSLMQGYRFLRRLENKLRLLHDQSISEISPEPLQLRKLARLLGYEGTLGPPEEQFLEAYRTTTEGLRSLFERYLCPAATEEGESQC